MHTVVETLPFVRAAASLLSKEKRAALIATVALDPEAGDIMQGTGGYRKLRFARSGMGKRGGLRVVYLCGGEDFPVFLVALYAKSDRGNLSKAELNALAKAANAYFTDYRSKP